ncbi:MAG: ATP-binding cassette domain-containing protein [Chromatiales bacterium]|nr:ATP-binding cassette domain-containing protein [Chromatiales bacterium]
MTALKVDRLGKAYRMYATPKARFLELITGKPRHTPYWALRDLSFELAPGETLGIVGRNGAGKSTLMKLVAGTLQPSEGSVTYKGRMTAILELGTGFHPEFTGRDNIYFGGALMGFSRAELRSVEAWIEDFSELGPALERPVKTYSSGMVVRLAFSLVTAIRPDLLIVDEALSVGDGHFQKKCIDRMVHIRSKGTTILFCSHSMHHIMQFCGRAIWLDGGQLMDSGPPAKIVPAYVAHAVEGRSAAVLEAPESDTRPQQRCVVESVVLLSPGQTVTRGERLVVEVRFRILTDGLFVFGVAFDRSDSKTRTIAETSLENGFAPVSLAAGEHRVEFGVETECLRAGRYEVHAGLLDETLLHIEDYLTVEIDLVDRDPIQSPAVMRTGVDWDLQRQFGMVSRGGES